MKPGTVNRTQADGPIAKLPARVRTGLGIARAGCVAMIAGGLGDQLVRQLLPAHAVILAVPLDQVPPRVEALVLALLHALGCSLMAAGIGALALLRQMRATGQRELAVWVAAMALLSEGANALFMHQLRQPLFLVPLSIACLVVIGLALYCLPAHSASEAAPSR